MFDLAEHPSLTADSECGFEHQGLPHLQLYLGKVKNSHVC